MQKQVPCWEEWHDALSDPFLGNVEAIRFVYSVMYIVEVWDDLIDKDKEVPGNFINISHRMMLYDLPRNKFYMQYIDQLNPLIMNAILAWHDANAMEKTGDFHDKELAYGLRNQILNLINYCAYLIGGMDHAIAVGPRLRRICTETLDEYVHDKGD